MPAGTELETWRGDALVSVVGFRFLDTRVLGVPVPCHRDFDEVNLRFYVHRPGAGDDVRRGVVFVREIVPRRAIAAVARVAYNEPYVRCPMRSRASRGCVRRPRAGAYEWRTGGRWHGLRLTAAGAASPVPPGSQAEFVTEHYWGYTRQRDGTTVKDQVRHRGGASGRDRRRTRLRRRPGLWSAVRGGALGDPCSAFLADGSEVIVYRPSRLPAISGSTDGPG